ncbi:hypothetical protein CP985_10940 [Malaciobacter mytili LMG 24559]|uniref:Helicase ATP-binding domain-containing protein n=1 Tax=Malaciobacter mytili LMG 24559 TaxID=1032238 RepID=A0AAX2AD70_9BACT|nr:DEAD/DEAH box helicase family protein [Malaciobacter mytili]AXH16313.1 helicase [Malaciobacter mytili LMG 24559]RXK14979.1 hypothetical protein CP985_10940 [Malaciobacter mytili LMG 24559]
MRTISIENIIKDNIEVFNKKLGDVLKPRFDIYNPKKYDAIISRILDSERKSFPMQAQKIAAIADELNRKKQKAVILSAEMGSGKTDMASKIAVTIAKNKRVNFIMCPPHLVDKWESELRKTETSYDKFKIIKVSKWEELIPYTNRDMRKEKVRYFFIVSREGAKLGYKKEMVFNLKKKIIYSEELIDGEKELVKKSIFSLRCPDCSTEISELTNFDFSKIENFPVNEQKQIIKENLSNDFPRKCPHCNTILRQISSEYQKKDNRIRLSIAEYVKRTWTKGKIELLIIDEIHEYKSSNSGQGNAMAQLASVSKKILGLTGTLLNGYASSLFYILFRINPYLMSNKLGYSYKDVRMFIEHFGAFEKQFTAEEVKEGKVTKKGKQINIKEKPKISPNLLTVLLDMVVFLRLDEIKMEEGEGLPPYNEEVLLVEKDEKIFEKTDSYIDVLAGKVKKNPKLLGNLANDSIGIYDMPFNEFNAQNEVIYNPEISREEFGLLNKEKALIKLVEQEFNLNRKVLVYVYFSNKSIAQDLIKILQNKFPNKKILFLPPSVSANKREEWIKNNPCDLLLANPELVKTGLDLLDFTTIIFYESTYNIFTLRQASRRSWRLGQKENIKVIFMAYKSTPQHLALDLISSKVNAASSLEGRLSGDDDLSAMADDDSIQSALAKSILKGYIAKDNINMESFENFGSNREWNPFEKYYLDRKNKHLTCEILSNNDKEIRNNNNNNVLEKTLIIENEIVNNHNDTNTYKYVYYEKVKGKKEFKRMEIDIDDRDTLNSIGSIQLALF